MIDREGRILFGSLLLLVLALAGSIVVDRQFGVAVRDRPLLSFLLVAGIAVALPHLYLAATDDGDRFRSRLRFAAITTAAFALAFTAEAEGIGYLLIAGIGTGSIVALVCYEIFAEYGAGTDDSVTRVS
ncbi:hypothetical protein [Natrinema salinisoli]|uniref:hypothetical protein n=1 Tax=Natrinema salinisoli TaxID=2878535 RepID=UPI001CF01AAC|nr:hypothetical protein [Natrinema salinisoli]